MPKLKTFTPDEAQELKEACEILIDELHEFNHHAEKGYCAELIDPAEVARVAIVLSQAAGKLAQVMLHTDYMQRNRAELEALRKQSNK